MTILIITLEANVYFLECSSDDSKEITNGDVTKSFITCQFGSFNKFRWYVCSTHELHVYNVSYSAIYEMVLEENAPVNFGSPYKNILIWQLSQSMIHFTRTLVQYFWYPHLLSFFFPFFSLEYDKFFLFLINIEVSMIYRRN